MTQYLHPSDGEVGLSVFKIRQDHIQGREPSPARRDLPRLRPAESELYDDLRHNRLGDALRLEQEHISYSWLTRRIDA